MGLQYTMIQSLEEFKELISNRNYIFHLHTNYTDGLNSVYDYFIYAFEQNIDLIIFTEHVRKDLRYNFYDLINEIKCQEKRFKKIKSLIGCEAKLLPGGYLDIPENILALIDLVCFACHSFPYNVDQYYFSFKNLFTDYNGKNL